MYWSRMGFDYKSFELLIKMKGGSTRLRILNALKVERDRFQIAKEMGVDWKTVDRQMKILAKSGFVEERIAYGQVKIYHLTPLGIKLLKTVDDLLNDYVEHQSQSRSDSGLGS